MCPVILNSTRLFGLLHQFRPGAFVHDLPVGVCDIGAGPAQALAGTTAGRSHQPPIAGQPPRERTFNTDADQHMSLQHSLQGSNTV